MFKRSSLKKLNNSYQSRLIVFLFCISVVLFLYEIFRVDVFIGYIDGQFYYSYLPEYFIKHNFGYTVKFPIGTALCNLPAFLVVHAVLSVLRPEIADGSSVLYQYGVGITGIVFFLLGIIFVYKTVKFLYNERIAFITSIIISLGTFLPAYATKYASFSHIYSFAFASIFMYLAVTLDDEDSIKRNLCLGLCAGMLFLIRNINIFFVLFYLLYELCQKNLRRVFLVKRLIPNFIGGLLMVFPQLLLWKATTGHFITNAYSDESFDYLMNPRVYQVLFSDAKGLFIFTPVLIFAVIGFFMGKDSRVKASNIAVGVVFVIEIYTIAAWWCWWLGGVYGERSFADVLGFLAIPLATFIDRTFGSKDRRLCNVFYGAVILFFIITNLVFLMGADRGIINETASSWYELSRAWRMF